MNKLIVMCLKIFIIFMLFNILSVYSLKCFECNSNENPECLNLTVNDTNSKLLVDCQKTIEGQETFCRKTYQKILNKNQTLRIMRKCGWILHKERTDYCERADSDFVMVTSCQCFTDACNSSGIRAPTVYLLIIAIFAFAYSINTLC